MPLPMHLTSLSLELCMTPFPLTEFLETSLLQSVQQTMRRHGLAQFLGLSSELRHRRCGSKEDTSTTKRQKNFGTLNLVFGPAPYLSLGRDLPDSGKTSTSAEFGKQSTLMNSSTQRESAFQMAVETLTFQSQFAQWVLVPLQLQLVLMPRILL